MLYYAVSISEGSNNFIFISCPGKTQNFDGNELKILWVLTQAENFQPSILTLLVLALRLGKH